MLCNCKPTPPGSDVWFVIEILLGLFVWLLIFGKRRVKQKRRGKRSARFLGSFCFTALDHIRAKALKRKTQPYLTRGKVWMTEPRDNSQPCPFWLKEVSHTSDRHPPPPQKSPGQTPQKLQEARSRFFDGIQRRAMTRAAGPKKKQGSLASKPENENARQLRWQRKGKKQPLSQESHPESYIAEKNAKSIICTHGLKVGVVGLHPRSASDPPSNTVELHRGHFS